MKILSIQLPKRFKRRIFHSSSFLTTLIPGVSFVLPSHLFIRLRQNKPASY
jgi:hypothetical protein